MAARARSALTNAVLKVQVLLDNMSDTCPSTKQANTSNPAFSIGLCWQLHIIPLLNLQQLGCLACTCSSFRLMVQEPGVVDWRAVAADRLKVELDSFAPLREASSEQAKYLMRQHAMACSNMRNGRTKPRQPFKKGDGSWFLEDDGSIWGWLIHPTPSPNGNLSLTSKTLKQIGYFPAFESHGADSTGFRVMLSMPAVPCSIM